MSTLNPILAGSAQSVEAYQQVIEQTSQAVAQWLKQPEMYQGYNDTCHTITGT